MQPPAYRDTSFSTGLALAVADTGCDERRTPQPGRNRRTCAGRPPYPSDREYPPEKRATTHRELWVRLAFEKLCAATVYLAERSSLALYTTKMTSGIVADGTNAVVIYEGHGLPHAVKRIDGEGASAIARAVSEAAFACDADMHSAPGLLGCIVLCGGSSQDEALATAVQAEVTTLTAQWNVSFPRQPAAKVQVRVSRPQRQRGALVWGWIGCGFGPCLVDPTLGI